MNKEYNLTYYCRETGTAYPARTAGAGAFIELLKDGETEKLSVHFARKKYRSCKSNNSSKAKNHFQKIKIERKRGFKEYLNETSEKLVSGFY